MSLIAAGGTTEPVTITNAAFFPDLDLDTFREAIRLDGTVTNERAVPALEIAMSDVNGQLAEWMQEQQAAGATALDEVAQPAWQPDGYYTRLYKRAVWSLAKANLVERYRDYDTTGTGHDRADALEPTDGDYRRDAAWAIADILGNHRTTVELI
ncbi:head completion/stabilization protein [Marinobacter sp. NFXS9]|uniref:head completion/stabilization protein n=1 Tax=Marinobacter sp. NFXS9 TaxID=2818433 RepID=UPI0032DF52C8